MNACKAATMITLFFSSSQGKNHYTVTSTSTLLSNLLKFHRIDIKRRWCFECMRWLIRAGYIRRKSRYVNDHDGLITQIPSMVTFTLKGVVWLVSKGVVGAKAMHKSMMTYLKKDDKRWPDKSMYDDGSYKPADPDERKRLEGLLGIVGRKIE